MQSTPLHPSLTGGQQAVENKQFSNELHRSSRKNLFLEHLISPVFLWQLSVIQISCNYPKATLDSFVSIPQNQECIQQAGTQTRVQK